MATHPVLASLLIVAGLIYAGGGYLMWQMRNARPGVEDETGFHFTDGADVIVPADEVRPEWFTGALAARFSGHRAEIFAATAAA
jgi:hypothetical protein